jgi:ArsR family transcriptional regulator
LSSDIHECRFIDVKEASGLLRLLGDEVRLRLLRALSQEALNVSELTAILGIAQSGVSRHLGLLRKAGLVVEERGGSFTWYRLAEPASPADARSPLWTWLHAEFDRAATDAAADDARLAEVRRVRQESFLAHGAERERGQFVPGRSWAAWGRALGLLLPPLDVADLGCGEGYLTIEAARWARRVVAIDRSATALARGREMARRRKVANIVWKRGELERVPLAAASVDLVLLSQALHHAERPEAALAEAWRILRPGGRVLILDLREHAQAWVRAKLGDRWQGFADTRLCQALADAGFTGAIARTGARRAGDPFVVIIAAATKPAASSHVSAVPARAPHARRASKGRISERS